MFLYVIVYGCEFFIFAHGYPIVRGPNFGNHSFLFECPWHACQRPTDGHCECLYLSTQVCPIDLPLYVTLFYTL